MKILDKIGLVLFSSIMLLVSLALIFTIAGWLDLDLVIDTKEQLMGFKLYSLITKIEEEFNKNVDAFEKSEIIENSKIDKEIKKTGVVVYEK